MKIDIHTHIIPENLPDYSSKFGYGGFIKLDHYKPCCAKMYKDGKFFREIQDNCWDPKTRISECNHHNVNVQVLSTIPVLFNYWADPHNALETSKFLNDHIAYTVNSYPDRFVGLGTLPLQDTKLAIKEMERCVEELKMPGIEIGSHVNDLNLNEDRFFPIFEAAESLGVSIFVHPWEMMGSNKMQKYWLPWLVGMPAETSRAICSMIFGGVFERLPNLKVCFSHGGGSFPMTIGRIEHGFNVRPDLVAIDNKVNPREYLGKFYIDSLVHDPSILNFLIELIGSNKIALGSDYPFPLGEDIAGTLIESMTNLSKGTKDNLLFKTAIEFLNLKIENYF